MVVVTDDCYAWALVEVPARYEIITKTVLKTPNNTKEITIPAEYETVQKTVLIEPAKTKIVEYPPVYKTIVKRATPIPVASRTIEIPAEYKTVTFKGLEDDKPFEVFELPVEYQTVTIMGPHGVTKREILFPAEYRTDTVDVLKTGSSTDYETVVRRTKIKEAYRDTIEIPWHTCGATKRIAQLPNPLDTFITINIKTNDIIRHYKPKRTEKITNEIRLDNVQIFPNPTTDILNVQSEENIERIQVLNAKGQIILSRNYENQNNIQLNISDLASGLYSVQMKTKKGFQTSKIIKQ